MPSPIIIFGYAFKPNSLKTMTAKKKVMVGNETETVEVELLIISPTATKM